MKVASYFITNLITLATIFITLVIPKIILLGGDDDDDLTYRGPPTPP